MRSVANDASSALVPRTKRTPSAIERRMLGRSATGSGGCGRMAAAAPTIARQLSASAV
jgi:hypothetical protein